MIICRRTNRQNPHCLQHLSW